MNETLDEQSREALGRIQVMGIISQTCSHNLQRFLCVFLFVAGLLNTSSMMAQKSEGKVVEGRMHTIIYKTDGTHVEGYLSHHILYGSRYLFKMDDMPYAKVFLSEEHNFNERRRKTLLDTFYMYPEMEDDIKQLTKDKVAEDPFYIIRKLDDILSMQKSDD